MKTNALTPAEDEIKMIASKMGKKIMRREQYKGDNVDYSQQPERRLWRGRLGRRGPLRQEQIEDEEEEVSLYIELFVRRWESDGTGSGSRV
jgi:hypothetical protein